MHKLLFITLILLVSAVAIAENTKIENGYEVNYNALSSSFLSPETAKNYHIPRSKTKGFINVAVLKQQKDKMSTPVAAKISVKAKNFYGQDKSINLRMIKENDGAIYYVSTFPVSSRETIKFNLSVVPEGSNKAIEINFEQEFFTD